MKLFSLIFLLVMTLCADNVKVYLYTPEINVNNFKSLKMSFDSYLSGYGNYELQPFSDKETFEKYLKNKNTIAILSSWHYREISKKYNLEAMLVAKKKGSVTDRKILVGQKNTLLKGVVTSAYDTEYTNELLNSITDEHSQELSVLRVPKEIDALMSVGFGMSRFALISKDTFVHLQHINPVLSKDLKIYYESDPEYRMLLACNETDKEVTTLVSIFKNMEFSSDGKKILNMIGIDKLVVFNIRNLENRGDTK
ncbi:MAG TPA: hypothetical protein CFH83_00140 [Sulfuricurvum kujiense]|uniref:Solute-binding protein family 3/N-terminal domain-containing protein n=2 Tax=Sulfurimonadaceae TaxID=2771471 RepID=A0A2D3WLA0_9BACT|nr:MAG: hypothetical protein A2517_03100 [Sulfuricurvum sp. RIFOXYD12_FULL_44_77]DAB39527.1 MAG TPA: hypothetical protein CFH83_00140 [Sulfuricurvum kujiense]